MQAIHFICGRDDSGGLKNLHFNKASQLYRSGNWDISEDDARSLVNGWLYLHPKKASPSEFGGIILGFEPISDNSVARINRIVLIVQKQPQCTGQSWRGKNYGMAYTSGVVEADFPYEKV